MVWVQNGKQETVLNLHLISSKCKVNTQSGWSYSRKRAEVLTMDQFRNNLETLG